NGGGGYWSVRNLIRHVASTNLEVHFYTPVVGNFRLGRIAIHFETDPLFEHVTVKIRGEHEHLPKEGSDGYLVGNGVVLDFGEKTHRTLTLELIRKLCG